MYTFAHGQTITALIPAGQRPWNFDIATELIMTVEDAHGQDQAANSVDAYLRVRGQAHKGHEAITLVKVGWVQNLARLAKD